MTRVRGARKSINEPVGDLPALVTKRATKGYRWPKGKSGNPAGFPRAIAEVYREVRRICVNASPEMAEGLIALARTAQDERVRSVCMLAVLDRAGIRPVEKVEDEKEKASPCFRSQDYDEEELAEIEAALLLLTDPARARALRGEAVEAEIIPPGVDDPSAL
jgi:hypothetical protein